MATTTTGKNNVMLNNGATTSSNGTSTARRGGRTSPTVRLDPEIHGELFRCRPEYLDDLPLIALTLLEVKPNRLESVKVDLEELMALSVAECGHPFSLCLERCRQYEDERRSNGSFHATVKDRTAGEPCTKTNFGDNVDSDHTIGNGSSIDDIDNGFSDHNQDNECSSNNSDNGNENFRDDDEPANLVCYSEHANQQDFEGALEKKSAVNCVQQLLLSDALQSIFRLSMWHRVNTLYTTNTYDVSSKHEGDRDGETSSAPSTTNNTKEFETSASYSMEDKNYPPPNSNRGPPQVKARFYMMRIHYLSQTASRETVLKILCRLAVLSVNAGSGPDNESSSSQLRDSTSSQDSKEHVLHLSTDEQGALFEEEDTTQEDSKEEHIATSADESFHNPNSYTCLSYEVLISNDVDRYAEILEIVSYPSRDDYMKHQQDIHAQQVSKMAHVLCEKEPQITLWQR